MEWIEWLEVYCPESTMEVRLTEKVPARPALIRCQPHLSRPPVVWLHSACDLPACTRTQTDVPVPGKVYRSDPRASIVNSAMTLQQRESQTLRLEALSRDSSPASLAAARELLLEYGRFVIAQPGAARFCFGSLENEAARLPDSYLEQGGGSLLAIAADTPAGFIAWRALAPSSHVVEDAWEMKRLWVRPAARGLNLGRQLTEAVIDRAVAAQRKAIYLDTAPASMGSAYRMYQQMGFHPCAPYNDTPVDGLVWLVKTL